MLNLRWNYRYIFFLLSLLDILAILVFYPAKSQAELPKSDVSPTEVEDNKAPQVVGFGMRVVLVYEC